MRFLNYIFYHESEILCIKDLNPKPDTLYLIEEKAGNSLDKGNHFLSRSLLSQAIRSKINIWDILKVKILLTVKYTIIWIKQKPKE